MHIQALGRERLNEYPDIKSGMTQRSGHVRPMVGQDAAEGAVGDNPRTDFCGLTARFNGMMERIDSAPGIYDHPEIFKNMALATPLA